jgi:hypothetical protein
MPRHFHQPPGAHARIPASALRAPLRGLSCPDGSRGVVGRQDAHDPRSTMGADPWHWCDSLTTDYWNPPTTESQHLRQRILAAIVAFILAAILIQAW